MATIQQGKFSPDQLLKQSEPTSADLTRGGIDFAQIRAGRRDPVNLAVLGDSRVTEDVALANFQAREVPRGGMPSLPAGFAAEFSPGFEKLLARPSRPAQRAANS